MRGLRRAPPPLLPSRDGNGRGQPDRLPPHPPVAVPGKGACPGLPSGRRRSVPGMPKRRRRRLQGLSASRFYKPMKVSVLRVAEKNTAERVSFLCGGNGFRPQRKNFFSAVPFPPLRSVFSAALDALIYSCLHPCRPQGTHGGGKARAACRPDAGTASFPASLKIKKKP